jgi:hypothetical protein
MDAEEYDRPTEILSGVTAARNFAIAFLASFCLVALWTMVA